MIVIACIPGLLILLLSTAPDEGELLCRCHGIVVCHVYVCVREYGRIRLRRCTPEQGFENALVITACCVVPGRPVRCIMIGDAGD